MSSPSESSWYYIDAAGLQRGPIDDATLRRLIGVNEIRRETPVWQEGMANWQPAHQRIDDLFTGMPPPPLPVAHAAAVPIGENAGVRMLIPVGRSAWAIAAGYLGLFSVLPVIAPVALIIGIIALRDLKRHPESHGAGRAWFGVIMGGIFSVFFVLMIAALVSSM